MLINCTNHPLDMWGEAQIEAAKCYGEVVDLPFPRVDPAWSVEELRRQADSIADRLEAQKPDAVLAAGEFTLLFMLVDRLLSDGVKVICTCSRRIADAEMRSDGSIEKKSVFTFETFREYAYYRKGK